MTKLERIAQTSMIAAALVLNAADNAAAEEQKQKTTPISLSASAGIVDKCLLLSGKRQGEDAMVQGSASVNGGNFGASSGINQDSKGTREIDLGLSYQRKLAENKRGKVTVKGTIDRRAFPDNGKAMYSADLILGAYTKIGDFSLLYRERFDTEDFESGRTAVFVVATPKLRLGKAAGIEASLKGAASLAYQDRFVGTSSQWGYFTPGISVDFKKGNTAAEAFLKGQKALRKELHDYRSGGVKVVYTRSGKK